MITVPLSDSPSAGTTQVRSARGISPLEVLDPHHEDDIVPVILKEPDHHGSLAVTLYVGDRFGDVEWGADPAHRYRVGDPRCEALHLVDLGLGESADDIGRVRDVFPLQSLMR
jgi:hypothetical protein